MSEYAEDMTIEELEAILNEKKLRAKINAIPKPIENIDIDAIIDFCETVINDVVSYGYVDGDIESLAYKTIMKAVYGDNIFDWIYSKYDAQK